MERMNCTVRLGGNLNATTELKNITVAEAVVLRAIHGADAIVNIEQSTNDGKKDTTSHRAELDKIRSKYPPKYHKLIGDLFPGFNPKLPATMEEAGFAETAVAPA